MTTYFKFDGRLSIDLNARESSTVSVRVRVLMRLMQLRGDRRLSHVDQLSIADLIGRLQVAYGLAGITELDAHLIQREEAA